MITKTAAPMAASSAQSIKSMAGNEVLSVRDDVVDEHGEYVVTAHTVLVGRRLEEPADGAEQTTAAGAAEGA